MCKFEISNDEFSLVITGKTITKAFYYIPIFYHKVEQGSYWNWYSLRFNGFITPGPIPTYISKVNAGECIKNIIIRDLSKDFNYSQSTTFVIDDMEIHDTTINEQGESLTRVLVLIGLDKKIDTSVIFPNGVSLNWHVEGYDNYNLVKKHFIGFSEDLYHTQSYVHICMDGSSSADPYGGRIDEYIMPDGSRDKVPMPIWF